MRILHCADLHCKDSVIDEAEKCLNFLVDAAAKEAVDLIIVAGDIFDSGDVKLDSKAAKLVVRIFSQLADIAPVAVIIGTPSHDGTAAEILSFVRGTFPIHVATKPEQVYLQSGIGFVDIADAVLNCDAVISLIPAPTKQFFQGNGSIKETDADIAQAMSSIFAGLGATTAGFDGPHILVGHWNVTGSLISETQTLTGVDIEISPDMMALSNASLCLLGHIHLPQQIKQNIFYSGSIFPLTWGENYDHGFYLHEQNDFLEGWISTFVQTPHKKMVRFAFDMTAGEKIVVPFEGIAGAVVRIDVSCFQDEAGNVGKDTIIENLKRWGAESVDIRINRIPRENIRADAVLKAERLSDKITAMAALRGDTVPESILVKADALELMNTDNLISTVTKGEAI